LERRHFSKNNLHKPILYFPESRGTEAHSQDCDAYIIADQ